MPDILVAIGHCNGQISTLLRAGDLLRDSADRSRRIRSIGIGIRHGSVCWKSAQVPVVRDLGDCLDLVRRGIRGLRES